MNTSVNSSPFRACIVIPHYNHSQLLSAVLEKIAVIWNDLPAEQCIIVDDGSDQEHQDRLHQLITRFDFICVQWSASNRGKGKATMAGFAWAIENDYTHALQIDADGQHNVADLKTFLLAGQVNPQHIISGMPVYDHTIPAARKYGRYLTRFFVWLNTLSFDIGDAQCGFRLYPLQTVKPLVANRHNIAAHMDFDIDIIVRLYWQGVPVINQPTKVIYPDDGVSHFSMFMDNVRISRCHTFLVFGMLMRLPKLIARKFNRQHPQNQ